MTLVAEITENSTHVHANTHTDTDTETHTHTETTHNFNEYKTPLRKHGNSHNWNLKCFTCEIEAHSIAKHSIT